MNKLLRKLFYSNLMRDVRNEYSEKLERINLVNSILINHTDERITSIHRISEVIQIVADNWSKFDEREQDELSLILAGGRYKDCFIGHMNEV